MDSKVKTFDEWAAATPRGQGCKHGAACIRNKYDPACVACYEAYTVAALGSIAEKGRPE
jgi:hypothetical protein